VPTHQELEPCKSYHTLTWPADARIQQILDQPGNYVFDAYACETVDGWVPDIGLTKYSNLIDPFGHGWTISSHIEDVPPPELT